MRLMAAIGLFVFGVTILPGTASASAPLVDVAAIPAYRIASDAPAGHRARGHRASRRVRRHHGGGRTVLRAPRASGAGIVRSGKTGATARVAARYVGRFQSYIDAIEASGARVLFMGGIRRGHCSQRHKHSCGMALDVCQLARGVVDARCGLPAAAAIAAMAVRFGLLEGGIWCHGDYGHAEVAPGARACPGRAYAVGRSVTPGRRQAVRHHRIHLAGRTEKRG
jgi:hypothetical protein